jgi:uncharacterized protein
MAYTAKIGIHLLMMFMPLITPEQIDAMAQTIADQFQPDSIYLFGSYAYGQPTEDSDLDFLVVMPVEDHPVRSSAKIRYALPDTVSIDVIVRDPKEVARRQVEPDGFISMILRDGRLLWTAQP